MDAYGYTILRRYEGVAVVESVHFQQIAAADVRSIGEREVLLGNVYPVRTHFHLVADLVVAKEFTVEDEVDKLCSRVEFQRGEFAHQGGYGIAHETFVTGICQQGPAFGLGVPFSEKFLF